MLSPFRMVCRDFILPEICKPCLFFFLRNLFYLTDAPAELHACACACALLELIQDLPVIKTVLLKPEDICAKLTDAPPEKLLRLSTLCLAALRQTLSACLTELDDID